MIVFQPSFYIYIYINQCKYIYPIVCFVCVVDELFKEYLKHMKWCSVCSECVNGVTIQFHAIHLYSDWVSGFIDSVSCSFCVYVSVTS
jgi:EamA domain-containing membrane protein RarD